MIRLFYYQLPGMFYAGNVRARSITEAKSEIRFLYNLKRLPKNAAVWES